MKVEKIFKTGLSLVAARFDYVRTKIVSSLRSARRYFILPKDIGTM